MSDFRVALVGMPFSGVTQPSIQLGLLKALAVQGGFGADTYHFYVDLAVRLPEEIVQFLSTRHDRMTGEWLFAIAAFGESAFSDQEYFERFPEEFDVPGKYRRDFHFFSELRSNTLPDFINHCAETIDWSRYSLVGFTTTFQQNTASLALARKIKQRYPSVKIIFGGANVEAEMGAEYFRSFSYIDFLATGEGDRLFPALLSRLQTGDCVGDIPGLLYRQGSEIKSTPNELFLDLDSLPVPNYDEYFERLKRLRLKLPSESKYTPFESSRGCWWGQKQHCTFCGLNGLGMAYRSKKPERLLNELESLYERYGQEKFCATDNILDWKYFDTFFNEASNRNAPYRFYYEIKANLNKDQIEKLYRGGVRRLQPGIESLSTHVLHLMRKGCTMLQNVLTLKCCHSYGISLFWSLLYGFPGETEEDYRNELEVIKAITHLPPPMRATRIRIDRYSPHFFDRENFPVTFLKPDESYSYVYPARVDLNKIAYFFDYEFQNTTSEEIHAAAKALVEEWNKRWNSQRRDNLQYRRNAETIVIEDSRRTTPSLFMSSNEPATYVFEEPAGIIYEFCDNTIRSYKQIKQEVEQCHGAIEDQKLQSILDTFVDLRFMLGEDGKYLSLAFGRVFQE